ncbi:MAG: 50S ribosomal protein L29 [Chitinophagales bacterium]
MISKLKKQDIRDFTTDELKAKVVQFKGELQKMHFNHAVSEIDNPLDLRWLRRDVARLLTEIKAREMAEN